MKFPKKLGKNGENYSFKNQRGKPKEGKLKKILEGV